MSINEATELYNQLHKMFGSGVDNYTGIRDDILNTSGVIIKNKEKNDR